MRTEYTTENGRKAMKIDCGVYEVKFFKSIAEHLSGELVIFTNKKTGVSKAPCVNWEIDWDDENEGGKLELKYRDRWGCEMKFIHYPPADLKGMFDFIGKGYDIFDESFPSNEP